MKTKNILDFPKETNPVGATFLAVKNNLTVKIGFENMTPLFEVLQLKPSSTPTSPQAGDIYFDSTTNKHRAYDGTNWHDLY